MTEGISTIADGSHQLTTEALDEVHHVFFWYDIGKDGHTLDEHTICTGQALVHTTVVHALIDYLLLTRQAAQHEAIRCHEQQVAAGAIVLTPLVNLVHWHEGTLAHHIAQTTLWVGGQTYKIEPGKLILIILSGSLIILCTK